MNNVINFQYPKEWDSKYFSDEERKEYKEKIFELFLENLLLDLGDNLEDKQKLDLIEILETKNLDKIFIFLDNNIKDFKSKLEKNISNFQKKIL